MTIALTPELAAALAQHSQQRGLTPDELAQQLLRDKLRELEQDAVGDPNTENGLAETTGTLADRFAGRIGVVAGKGFSARNSGKRFTEILLEKRREGKI